MLQMILITCSSSNFCGLFFVKIAFKSCSTYSITMKMCWKLYKSSRFWASIMISSSFVVKMLPGILESWCNKLISRRMQRGSPTFEKTSLINLIATTFPLDLHFAFMTWPQEPSPNIRLGSQNYSICCQERSRELFEIFEGAAIFFELAGVTADEHRLLSRYFSSLFIEFIFFLAL